MAHHAYFITGESEKGIERALAHAEADLGLARENNPDLIVLRHGLFSVDDARKIIDLIGRKDRVHDPSQSSGSICIHGGEDFGKRCRSDGHVFWGVW